MGQCSPRQRREEKICTALSGAGSIGDARDQNTKERPVSATAELQKAPKLPQRCQHWLGDSHHPACSPDPGILLAWEPAPRNSPQGTAPFPVPAAGSCVSRGSQEGRRERTARTPSALFTNTLQNCKKSSKDQVSSS